MDGNNKVAFKFRVKQEYDVIIYYERGVVADEVEEAASSVEEDVLNLAFNDEGLVVRTEEETENANPYMAFVRTHDPTVTMVYHVQGLPKELEKELKEKGLNNG